MGKFLNIEKLIRMEIIKLKVPDVLGKSPEWKAVKSKKKGHLQQRSKKRM
jgi:hypothetical protein